MTIPWISKVDIHGIWLVPPDEVRVPMRLLAQYSDHCPVSVSRSRGWIRPRASEEVEVVHAVPYSSMSRVRCAQRCRGAHLRNLAARGTAETARETLRAQARGRAGERLRSRAASTASTANFRRRTLARIAGRGIRAGQCPGSDLGPGVDAELAHDVRDVPGGGGRGDDKLISDCLIAASSGDQASPWRSGQPAAR